jgi:hypothetical protein
MAASHLCALDAASMHRSTPKVDRMPRIVSPAINQSNLAISGSIIGARMRSMASSFRRLHSVWVVFPSGLGFGSLKSSRWARPEADGRLCIRNIVGRPGEAVKGASCAPGEKGTAVAARPTAVWMFADCLTKGARDRPARPDNRVQASNPSCSFSDDVRVAGRLVRGSIERDSCAGTLHVARSDLVDLRPAKGHDRSDFP